MKGHPLANHKPLKPNIMKGKPIIKFDLPLYEMNEVERVINACRVLDYTGQQLLEQALAEFLDNHNL